ncbi:MAG TPA: hypothetical protein VFW46_04705 [Stellaceae bacterium]|nr:hypothetical protein [Stellaceae bacterium]
MSEEEISIPPAIRALHARERERAETREAELAGDWQEKLRQIFALETDWLRRAVTASG